MLHIQMVNSFSVHVLSGCTKCLLYELAIKHEIWIYKVIICYAGFKRKKKDKIIVYIKTKI